MQRAARAETFIFLRVYKGFMRFERTGDAFRGRCARRTTPFSYGFIRFLLPPTEQLFSSFRAGHDHVPQMLCMEHAVSMLNIRTMGPPSRNPARAADPSYSSRQGVHDRAPRIPFVRGWQPGGGQNQADERLGLRFTSLGGGDKGRGGTRNSRLQNPDSESRFFQKRRNGNKWARHENALEKLFGIHFISTFPFPVLARF